MGKTILELLTECYDEYARLFEETNGAGITHLTVKYFSEYYDYSDYSDSD